MQCNDTIISEALSWQCLCFYSAHDQVLHSDTTSSLCLRGREEFPYNNKNFFLRTISYSSFSLIIIFIISIEGEMFRALLIIGQLSYSIFQLLLFY